jgi:hypothetical protein
MVYIQSYISLLSRRHGLSRLIEGDGTSINRWNLPKIVPVVSERITILCLKVHLSVRIFELTRHSPWRAQRFNRKYDWNSFINTWGCCEAHGHMIPMTYILIFGTIGQKWPQYKGLSPTPLAKIYWFSHIQGGLPWKSRDFVSTPPILSHRRGYYAQDEMMTLWDKCSKITQFRAPIETNGTALTYCISISYVFVHEYASGLSFHCIVSICQHW